MILYTASQEFYLGNLYYEDSFDFCRIMTGEVIGVLSGGPYTQVKGKVVAGVPISSAYQYLVAGAIVPDPSVSGGVPTAPVAVPASNVAPGAQGTWSFDGTYYYWCTTPNHWVRMAVETVFP